MPIVKWPNAILLLVCCMALPVHAQPPALINYQGRLVDGPNLISGTLMIEMRLYDAASGGTLLYTDFHPAVEAVDGLFDVQIGANPTFGNLATALDSPQVWLELEVDSILLSPRERLVSVPYAMQAGSVGAGSIGFNQLAQPYQAGRIELRDLVPSGPTFGAASPTLSHDVSISFNSPFSAQPSFSASLLIPDLLTAADTSLVPISTSLTNAAMRLTLPRVHQSLGLPFSVVSSASIVDGRPARVVPDFNSLWFQIAADAKGETWNDLEQLLFQADEIVWASLTVIAGHPAIAYFHEIDALATGVYYMRALDAQGSSWGAPVQISSDVVTFVDMIEVNNRPAMAFETVNLVGPQSNTLWYAVANDATGTSWNIPQQLDNIVSSNFQSLGSYTPRLIMSETLPAVVYTRQYMNPSSYSLHFRRAGTIHGTGSWTADVTIFTNAGSFSVFRIPFDAKVVAGHPAVVVADQAPTPRIRYIRANDGKGETWPAGAVVLNEDLGSGGSRLSMHVIDGRPAIAALTGSFQDAKLLYQRAFDAGGGSWVLFAARDLTHPSVNPGLPLLREVDGEPAIFYDGRFLRSRQVPEGSLHWMAVQP